MLLRADGHALDSARRGKVTRLRTAAAGDSSSARRRRRRRRRSLPAPRERRLFAASLPPTEPHTIGATPPDNCARTHTDTHTHIQHLTPIHARDTPIPPLAHCIGVETGGATGVMAPSLFNQNIIKNLMFFFKHNRYLYGQRFSWTRKAQNCVEIDSREVSFYSRRDRNFTGPLTLGDVPTPLAHCVSLSGVWKVCDEEHSQHWLTVA